MGSIGAMLVYMLEQMKPLDAATTLDEDSGKQVYKYFNT